MRIVKASKIFQLTLILFLLPVAAGIFCTCAEAAAPSPELALNAAPCHDCCPHMAVGSSDCQTATYERSSSAVLENIRSLVKVNFKSLTQPVSTASDSLIVIGTGGTDLLEFSFSKAEQPLYLLHQTLLI